MKNKIQKSSYIFITLLLSFCFASLSTYSSTTSSSVGSTRTLSRTLDAIIIPGKDLAGVTERNISNLRLLRLHNGTMSPVPFQIDQRDANNQWVWDQSSGAKRTHDDDDPEGQQVFDDNDVLVFIASDLGNKVTNPNVPADTDFVYEIAITDPVDNTKGWVYLAHYPKSPPTLSAQHYISFNKSKRTISAENYEFIYSDKYIAVMDTLRLNGQSILDRTKVRGQVELDFFLFQTTINFNEEDIGGYNEGYISGPVRLIKRSINHLVIEGMDTPDVVCDHFFYPEYSELPIAITMQFPVKKVTLRVTGDYFGGQFKHVYAEGLEKPLVLSERLHEEDFIESIQSARWMGLDGKDGSIILSIKAPELIKSHLSIKPWLVVDTTIPFPPESIPGVNPEAGFKIETIEDFPSGKYVLHAIYRFSDKAYKKQDALSVTELLHQPLKYSIIQKK